MHDDEAMTATEWFNCLCGWSLTDIADELGIERGTGRQQIIEIARRQVETARLEAVALTADDVERYLSDLWALIDEDDGDEDAEDSQDDCGRPY